MLKPDSLYNKGMKILTYSEKRVKQFGNSWIREGDNVAYYKNCIKRSKGHYYTLSFSIDTQCK